MAEATLQKGAQSVGAYTPGAFVWHEFGTKDLSAAKKFYGGLFGWTFHTMPMGDMDYHMIHLGEVGIGGLYQLDGKVEAPSAWLGSISVKDVDASVKAAEKAGGKVAYGPMDIPNIGRFASIIDPEGCAFGVFRSLTGDPVVGKPKAGEFCWDDLLAKDPGALEGFYKAVIGWVTGSGPAGVEEKMFKYGEENEASLGKAPEGVHPHWLTYVTVGDLQTSKEKAVELGAKIIVEQVDMPFGSYSVLQDPIGGYVGLFAGKEC